MVQVKIKVYDLLDAEGTPIAENLSIETIELEANETIQLDYIPAAEGGPILRPKKVRL